MWKRSLRRSEQFVLVAISFLSGVLVARFFWTHVAVVLMILAPPALLVFRLKFALVLVFVLVAGVWRGQATLFSNTPLGQLMGSKVAINGTVSDDPGLSESGQTAFVMKVTEIDSRPSGGSLRVYAVGSQKLSRGYLVEVRGTLKSARGIVPAQISYGQVVVVSRTISPLEKLRQQFFTALRNVMPEPMSGLGIGLLLGARALIDKPLQDTLSSVGLSHIIAVSGSNLTILILAARRFLMRASAFTTVALSAWLIFAFLLLTGFSAPIVRAAWVSGLSLFIRYYGYKAKPMTLIAVPAIITVAYKPDYLVLDLGWQLSFLAFFGVMILAPLLAQRFISRPNVINMLFMESLSAHVMTAPLILGIFGSASIIAPLANAVVVPLVPLAMLLGFVAGVVAMVLPALGAWFALPATGLLGLMIGTAEWFAGWPYASITPPVAVWTSTALYGVITVSMAALWRGAREKSRHDSNENTLFG